MTLYPTHDPALVEVVARALDRNGVMDVPDGTVGISCGWPENAKYHLRVDARRALDAIPRPALPADVAALMTEIEALKRERDALEEAANSVCFRWFDSLGECGHLGEAMEKLQAASQQRQAYLRAVGDDDASKEADGPSRRLDDTTNARTGPEPMP